MRMRSRRHTQERKKQDRIFSDSFFESYPTPQGIFLPHPAHTCTGGIPIGKDGVRWPVSMAAATYIHTFIDFFFPPLLCRLNEQAWMRINRWMEEVDEQKNSCQADWMSEGVSSGFIFPGNRQRARDVSVFLYCAEKPSKSLFWFFLSVCCSYEKMIRSICVLRRC